MICSAHRKQVIVQRVCTHTQQNDKNRRTINRFARNMNENKLMLEGGEREIDEGGDDGAIDSGTNIDVSNSLPGRSFHLCFLGISELYRSNVQCTNVCVLKSVLRSTDTGTNNKCVNKTMQTQIKT